MNNKEKVRTYLDKLVEEGWTNAPTGERVLSQYDRINRLRPGFPNCDIGPSESGDVYMTWDTEGLYLECAVMKHGGTEWFFRERGSSLMVGNDYGDDWIDMEASQVYLDKLKGCVT